LDRRPYPSLRSDRRGAQTAGAGLRSRERNRCFVPSSVMCRGSVNRLIFLAVPRWRRHIARESGERAPFVPSTGMEGAMLERFFLKPQTVDRITGCWLGPRIELYVMALCEQGYSA